MSEEINYPQEINYRRRLAKTSAKWRDSWIVVFILTPTETIWPGIEVDLNLTTFSIFCS